MRGSQSGLVGAMLCFGAAALTVLGSLQDHFTAGIGPNRLVITGWDMRVEVDGESQPDFGIIINGAPLMIAVAVLLAAAVLGMLAARRPSAARFGRASGLTAVIGAAFLAATVSTVGVQELFWLNIFRFGPDPEGNGAVQVGPGFWTLVASAALAVVAAVVAWRSGRPRPEPEREEPDTPRLGTPVVVRRLPDAPSDDPR